MGEKGSTATCAYYRAIVLSGEIKLVVRIAENLKSTPGWYLGENPTDEWVGNIALGQFVKMSLVVAPLRQNSEITTREAAIRSPLSPRQVRIGRGENHLVKDESKRESQIRELRELIAV